MMDNYHTIVVL